MSFFAAVADSTGFDWMSSTVGEGRPSTRALISSIARCAPFRVATPKAASFPSGRRSAPIRSAPAGAVRGEQARKQPGEEKEEAHGIMGLRS
jgi:hypothetical protein